MRSEGGGDGPIGATSSCRGGCLRRPDRESERPSRIEGSRPLPCHRPVRNWCEKGAAFPQYRGRGGLAGHRPEMVHRPMMVPAPSSSSSCRGQSRRPRSVERIDCAAHRRRILGADEIVPAEPLPGAGRRVRVAAALLLPLEVGCCGGGGTSDAKSVGSRRSSSVASNLLSCLSAETRLGAGPTLAVRLCGVDGTAGAIVRRSRWEGITGTAAGMNE